MRHRNSRYFFSWDRDFMSNHKYSSLKPPRVRSSVWLEHRPFKPGVAGSNPVGPAKCSIDDRQYCVMMINLSEGCAGSNPVGPATHTHVLFNNKERFTLTQKIKNIHKKNINTRQEGREWQELI